MLFLFNCCNHSKTGRISLEDPMRIIAHQLQELGHRVEFNDEEYVSAEDGINVLMEGFTPRFTAEITRAKSEGARFICIATEEPTPKGFNSGLIMEAVKRALEFPNAAKNFDAILYLIPGRHVHEWYSQFAPSAFIELGYAPTLVRSQYPMEPTWDFGFFGTLTKRRHKILKRLRTYCGSQKAVRIECMFPSAEERDKVMLDTRVILQLRKDDKMGFISSMRCNTALCLGRPILCEPHDLSDESPWSHVVKFSESLETFYQDAVLMRSAWRGVHSAQFQKFRTMLTPQFCIGRALEEIKLNLS